MTCPKCGTLASRVVGVDLPEERVLLECSLCETLYRVAPLAWLPPEPSYYSLQPEPLPPRGLVARVRGALRGAVVGWKGGVL